VIFGEETPSAGGLLLGAFSTVAIGHSWGGKRTLRQTLLEGILLE
tara:strand:+ start:122 stop:256 length:135 start_codon:yes stop_codon:yes gene_type:complete